MSVKVGNLIKLNVATKTLVGQTGGSLSLSRETIDATTKDSGEWGEILLGNKSGSVKLDALYDPDAASGTGALDMLALFSAGTLAVLKWGETASGTKYMSASGYITSFDQDAPDGDLTTYSCSFTITGAVTTGTN